MFASYGGSDVSTWNLCRIFYLKSFLVLVSQHLQIWGWRFQKCNNHNKTPGAFHCGHVSKMCPICLLLKPSSLENLQVLGVSLTSLKFLLSICLLIALNLTTQTQYNWNNPWLAQFYKIISFSLSFGFKINYSNDTAPKMYNLLRSWYLKFVWQNLNGKNIPDSTALCSFVCSWRQRRYFVPSPSPAKPTVRSTWHGSWARVLLTSSHRPGKKVKSRICPGPLYVFFFVLCSFSIFYVLFLCLPRPEMYTLSCLCLV